jgi:hypothetical protein
MLVFAAVVGDVEEVVCPGVVVEVPTLDDAGVWTLDDAGAWTLDDAVEVCTGDEPDEVGWDVEEHPVRHDVVITNNPAIIGIEFFTAPALHQRWEHNSTMTHQRLLSREAWPVRIVR